jgi:hypothetical protein
MKPLSDDIRRALPFAAFLNDLGGLGVEPVAQGGQRYAVIAARSNLRWWLLPLDSRPAAAAGLDMLQPVTHAAKLAKKAARGLALLGPHALLGCGHLRLSRLPDLNETFDGRATHMSFFTGTDGPHRKTSMQIMDIDGAILGYAKMSRAVHLRPYLRNEAKVLTRLKELGLTSVGVPTVQVIRDDDRMTLLITDSLKSSSHRAPLRLGIEHLFFLDELRAKTERLGAGEVLDGLERRMVELASVGGTDWTERIASVTALLRPVQDQIPVCFAHGDFTPWNTFLQDGRLYVFDWEYANLAWPVGFDLVHFMLATTPPGQQPQELSRVLERLANAQFDGNERAARRALLLSLACHALLYLGRLAEVQGALMDWGDGPVRAALIDGLLDLGGHDA